jgi:hypothetical protein
VVECGAEDFRYGVAINRIRNYYKQIAGDQAKLFLLSGHDDGRGVFENAAVPPEGRKQFFTFATVVAVINSVVGGSAIAIALGAIADASLGVTAGVGGVAALVSLVALLRYADRLLEERAGRTESIFPSPYLSAQAGGLLVGVALRELGTYAPGVPELRERVRELARARVHEPVCTTSAGFDRDDRTVRVHHQERPAVVTENLHA